MKCEGKIALVTGCTSGIGKATMYKLLEEGADVYMLVRNLKRGKKLAEATEEKYPGKVRGVLYFECDKLETIESSIKEAYEDAGRIDIFINNAIGGASAAKDNLTVTETSHETCMGLMESILGVSAECARVGNSADDAREAEARSLMYRHPQEFSRMCLVPTMESQKRR